MVQRGTLQLGEGALAGLLAAFRLGFGWTRTISGGGGTLRNF
jgi:hypothetical protein